MQSNLLHETAKNISIPLANNFNISMETMKLPESWKEANVTPLHKKGPKQLVENFRPIRKNLLAIAYWTTWRDIIYLLLINMVLEKVDLVKRN
jgi:hypothetical protein